MNTIPTSEQLAAIKAACDQAKTPYENWEHLTGLNYDNPVPCPQIPKPIVPIEMFGILTEALSRKALIELGSVLVEIRRQIEEQHFDGTLEWSQVLVAAGKMTRAEYAAIEKYVTDRRDGIETRPDPDWPLKVDWGTSQKDFGEPIPYAWVLEAS